MRPMRLPVVSDFQTDAIELEERVPPGVARLTLYAVTAFVACAILWASLASVDEIVVAPGRLVTTKPTIVVQPLETSIIRSIDVAVGDRVHAGDRLATLDATFSQSDMEQQQARFAALDAQVKRIEAEVDDLQYRPEAAAAPDARLQQRLFDQTEAFYAAQIENYDEQIAAQAATIRTSQEQADILRNRIATLGEIETARDTLYKKEVGSFLNLLVSRDTRLDVNATLAQTLGRSVEAEHARDKLKAERQAFIEDFRRNLLDKLVDLRGQRDTVAEELKKAALRRNMVSLSAPADAVVLELAQRSIGSVVREAEPIVTLVPLDVPLEAEVSVGSADIGRVLAGDGARVKFDAYPFQKFGTMAGTVRTISRDAFNGEPKVDGSRPSMPVVFRARVRLADATVGQSSEGFRLLPGMTASAEIKVGHRKVISYLLYPLLRGLDESMREP
ncbi:HlyD family type I secretion periplasmic adaptor subunit [Aureimonas leprariae]|nr:HlyD family type I secretion periplasmic adaptor subunit [Aureimonas leprariae]